MVRRRCVHGLSQTPIAAIPFSTLWYGTQTSNSCLQCHSRAYTCTCTYLHPQWYMYITPAYHIYTVHVHKLLIVSLAEYMYIQFVAILYSTHCLTSNIHIYISPYSYTIYRRYTHSTKLHYKASYLDTAAYAYTQRRNRVQTVSTLRSLCMYTRHPVSHSVYSMLYRVIHTYRQYDM